MSYKPWQTFFKLYEDSCYFPLKRQRYRARNYFDLQNCWVNKTSMQPAQSHVSLFQNLHSFPSPDILIQSPKRKCLSSLFIFEGDIQKHLRLFKRPRILREQFIARLVVCTELTGGVGNAMRLICCSPSAAPAAVAFVRIILREGHDSLIWKPSLGMECGLAKHRQVSSQLLLRSFPNSFQPASIVNFNIIHSI